MAFVDAMAARLEAAGVAYGHGTTNSFDEAAWLVLWSLGLPLDSLDEQAQMPLGPEQVQAAEDLVQRRIRTRQPAAYLTREAWLHGHSFYVDERTIVPRSLIAEPLLDGRVQACLEAPVQTVLDLCSGNGSLAILAALAWPDSQVTASDLSADALAVAAINVQRHGLGERVRLRQGDGLQAMQGQVFDLVLCNPPYVNEQSMQALPAEFGAEPRLALAGGMDGMDFIRPLLRQLPDHLSPQGALVLEIGHELEHFERAFARLECLWLDTSAGDACVALMTRRSLVDWLGVTA